MFLQQPKLHAGLISFSWSGSGDGDETNSPRITGIVRFLLCVWTKMEFNAYAKQNLILKYIIAML